MIDKIYDRFADLIKAEYPEQAQRILGMLYVAAQEEMNIDAPLNSDHSEFDKEHQQEVWAEVFKCCNTYQDALIYLRSADLEQADIEDGIKQVGDAQKNDLFSQFLVVRRSNPVPVEKPQFIEQINKPMVAQIEVSKKDGLSMKIHIERFIKSVCESRGALDVEKSRITVHKVPAIPNYREFWVDFGSPEQGYICSEYMDVVEHHGDFGFVSQYLFEQRMTPQNKEQILQELRKNNTN